MLGPSWALAGWQRKRNLLRRCWGLQALRACPGLGTYLSAGTREGSGGKGTAELEICS